MFLFLRYCRTKVTSIVLSLVLQNNSKYLHLKNVVVRFQSVENDTNFTQKISK